MDEEPIGRRSIRLKDYDYAQAGAYCVTICTQNRAQLFGAIEAEIMRLCAIRNVVNECWLAIRTHFQQVELDMYVVMPNHLHGILVITDDLVSGERGRATHVSPLQRPLGSKKGSLGAIVGAFKAGVTKRVREAEGLVGLQIWQQNYYEQIIRNERLNALREYILANPATWALDEENPVRG
jgi:putative transposase